MSEYSVPTEDWREEAPPQCRECDDAGCAACQTHGANSMTPADARTTPTAEQECRHQNTELDGPERPHRDPAMRNSNWREQDYQCLDCGARRTTAFHRARPR